MKNQHIVRREALEASLATVRYKIKNLQPHFSKEQVRCWYRLRNHLINELRMLPADADIQKNAKRVNYSNSSKIKRTNSLKYQWLNPSEK